MEKQGVVKQGLTPEDNDNAVKVAGDKIEQLEDHVTKRAADTVTEAAKKKLDERLELDRLVTSKLTIR